MQEILFLHKETHFLYVKHDINEPQYDKTNKMSVRPASAQSDQSLRCPYEESLGP